MCFDLLAKAQRHKAALLAALQELSASTVQKRGGRPLTERSAWDEQDTTQPDHRWNNITSTLGRAPQGDVKAMLLAEQCRKTTQKEQNIGGWQSLYKSFMLGKRPAPHEERHLETRSMWEGNHPVLCSTT
jgi:hypothetical protein